MSTRRYALLCGVLALAPRLSWAQKTIPVVDLPPASARATQSFGAVLGLHQTADGNVLVNDPIRRRLTLFDSMLAVSAVVMDSAPGTSHSYGRRATPLIPYVGDSSLFADWNARTMLVLDGRGRVARALALPKPQDLSVLNSGFVGLDDRGRLIFRGGRTGARGAPLCVGCREDSSRTPVIPFDDSVPLLRADLDFRHVDTVGRVSRPLMKVITQKSSDGKTSTIFALDPLQPIDDWTVLSNGTITLVRGHDYHVDWVQPDGAAGSTAKLPFDWRRLSDDDKQRLADSVRAAQNTMLANGYPTAEYWFESPVSCGPPEGLDPGAGSGRGGGRGGGGGEAPPAAAERNDCSQILLNSASPIGGPPRRPRPLLLDLVRRNQIADYDSPIRAGSTVADLDGNLWILPRVSTLSIKGELVYDVVSAKGELFERVRLPADRAIAGFGKGGVVYLTSGNIANGFYLERTMLGGTGAIKK